MTINKTINTNVIEQIKSGLIIALIVGVGAFWYGVQFQKHATVSVQNRVVVQTVANKSDAPLK